VDDAPEFRVGVPIRCFHRDKIFGRMEVCGSVARWQRPGATSRHEFFCDAHRRPGDEPIAFAAHVPRLSVVIELVVAGTSWHAGHARQEAVERLVQAVEAVGGCVNLHSVLFQTGRYLRPVPEPAANTAGGEG
jgi:hypothetical protein